MVTPKRWDGVVESRDGLIAARSTPSARFTVGEAWIDVLR